MLLVKSVAVSRVGHPLAQLVELSSIEHDLLAVRQVVAVAFREFSVERQLRLM